MSNPNETPATPESKNESSGASCAAGCNHRGAGIMRAVLYTPVVLIVGGLAALATFPDLAKYATPLIGDSGEKNSCPLSNLVSAVSGVQCCPSMRASAASAGSCCSKRSACCSASEESVSESDEPINAELTSVEIEPLGDDQPADAISAVNMVTVNSIEAETLSN